jgi:hypothetical protein
MIAKWKNTLGGVKGTETIEVYVLGPIRPGHYGDYALGAKGWVDDKVSVVPLWRAVLVGHRGRWRIVRHGHWLVVRSNGSLSSVDKNGYARYTGRNPNQSIC